MGTAYSQKGDKNILDETLDKLLGKKIVFITDGKIANTELLNFMHLRIGNRVRRITYQEYLQQDRERMKDFNKTHLTVTPNPDISSMNYSPEKVFEGGCQIIAMNFQYVGDHMKQYLSDSMKKFYGKTF